MQQGIFLLESASSADSLTVFVWSPRVISCIKFVCTLKITNTGSHIPLFGHTKILYTLIRMGSSAHAATVPYPGKVTLISHKGSPKKESYINPFPAK